MSNMAATFFKNSVWILQFKTIFVLQKLQGDFILPGCNRFSFCILLYRVGFPVFPHTFQRE